MVYFNDVNDLKKLENHLITYKKKLEELKIDDIEVNKMDI
jgi:hypothetical protein